MIVLLWVTPFFLLLGSSYYFNKNKIKIVLTNIYILTLLDAIVSYGLFMLIFKFFFSNSVVVMFFLLLLSLVAALILFYYQGDDISFDRQIETIKNNLILFISSIIVFTLFFMIFRNQALWIRLLISSQFTGVFIYISLPIKIKLSKTYIKILDKGLLYTDTSIITVLFVTLSIIIFSSLFMFVRFLNTDFGYIYEERIPLILNVDGEVIDFYEDKYIYIHNDFTSKEELYIRVATDNTVSYDVVDVTYNNSGATKNTFSTQRFHLLSSLDILFTPMYGAYLNDSLISFTEGYKTEYVNDSYCEECLILEISEDIYDIYDIDLQFFETIDLTDSIKDLIIIDDTLFLEDDSYYYLYADQTLKFDKNGPVLAYSQNEKTFYTLSTSGDTLVYTIQSDDGTTYSGNLTIQEGNTVKSLTVNLIYNPITVYLNNNIEEVNDNLLIHSVKTNDYWISFVEYDAKQYSLNMIGPIETHLSYIEFNLKGGIIVPTLYVITGFVEEDHHFEIYLFVEILISILVFVSLLVPYSNYSNYDTTIDFNSQFKDDETKGS